MFIATLIASDRLHAGDISTALDCLREAHCAPMGSADVETGVAADLLFDHAPKDARVALEGRFEGIDVVVQPTAARAKRLLVADMDSTMITVECIDELADYAELRAEISAVTERAMRGELAFEAALDARVALLKGLPESVLAECYADRVRVTPGAKALVRTMQARGGRTLLVSGGFTYFADRVADEIGFDAAVSNVLGVTDGVLDGTVARPIVGAQAKKAALLAAIEEYELERAYTLAIGDGANDIPMIEAAGLGVAYHAKPATAITAGAIIQAGDLSALLYAQGITRRHWVEG